MKFEAKNVKTTQKLAKLFARSLHGGEIVLLNGDLGAGKTTFTKFLAKCLGVKEEVTSPTFTIMKEYTGKNINLVHFDMYRLSSGREAEEFGFSEAVAGNNKVVVIEWSENIKDVLKGEFIEVNIVKTGETSRSFSFNNISK